MDREQPESQLILLVDDNTDALLLMERILQLKGYSVRACYNGEEALAAADRWRPAVVILDLAMPDRDGYSVCRLIRAHEWGKRMHLIALSGYSSADDQQLSQHAGFDAHLIKPVDWAKLIQLLDQALANPS